jgi:nucleotide-binding universal stress UspA family protein
VKVLLGVGGSEDSVRALETTVDRARAAGDDLTVAVFENPDSAPATDEVVERVRETLAAAGVEATVRRVRGDPGSELVALAEREGYDRVVLGGGTRSPMGKIELGPVAQFVVVNAPVSVTLVR